MGNNLAALNPQIWAQEFLQNFFNMTVMANLVHRDFEPVLANKGDTVNTRKPSTFVANDMGATIQIQDATATNVQVVLNKWKEVSFLLGDKDLTLSIGDLFQTYALPAMEALVQQIDADLLGLYTDVTTSVGVAGTDVAKATVLAARLGMNNNKVPMQGRRLVLSAKDDNNLISLPEFSSAEKIGDNGTAMREASLGRIYGFDTFMDQNVKTTGAAPVSTHNVAFHRNAFALVTRPLAMPMAGSGANVAVVNHKGIGIRVAVQWDINKKQHVVSLDVLYGVKTLDDKLAVRVLA